MKKKKWVLNIILITGIFVLTACWKGKDGHDFHNYSTSHLTSVKWVKNVAEIQIYASSNDPTSIISVNCLEKPPTLNQYNIVDTYTFEPTSEDVAYSFTCNYQHANSNNDASAIEIRAKYIELQYDPSSVVETCQFYNLFDFILAQSKSEHYQYLGCSSYE